MLTCESFQKVQNEYLSDATFSVFMFPSPQMGRTLDNWLWYKKIVVEYLQMAETHALVSHDVTSLTGMYNSSKETGNEQLNLAKNWCLLKAPHLKALRMTYHVSAVHWNSSLKKCLVSQHLKLV